jgi:hypothetical protein
MTKIILEIKDCTGCPFHMTTPYPTADSWERAENWFCTHPTVKHCDKDKLVSGYVGTFEKVPIPFWCPIYVPQEGDVREEGKEMFINGEWQILSPSSTIPGAIELVKKPIDFTATDNNE